MKAGEPKGTLGRMRSRHMFVSWIFLLSLASFTSGCAFVRGEVGEPFPEDRIGELHKGISTRQDVAQRFGAPDEIVQANGHEIFHYRRFDSKFGWLIFMSRLNVASDNLWVFLNAQGIVEDVVFGNRTADLSFQVWPFGD
jgi:hypothetical protein